MYIAGMFFPILTLVFLGLGALFSFILFVLVFAEAMTPPMMPPMFASAEFHQRQRKRMEDAFNTRVFLGMGGALFAVLAVISLAL